ncbi:replicative DNA helicase [Kitasatospora sp. NPDC101157]|uniref:replicative DNA helicase n=1 Tax=Kitasatospora sp. NPDC101157 TaxID=3364098 RepID=UPI00381A3DCE
MNPDPYGDEPPEGEQDADPRPRDLAAERAVIGAMLLSRRAVDEIAPVLGDGEAFYHPAHAKIYETVLRLHDNPGGVAADPITVAAALRTSGELLLVGGETYLHTCVSAVPTAANGVDYADIVHEVWQLRRMYEIGHRLTVRARMPEASPDEVAAAVLAEVQALFGNGAGGKVEKLSVAERWEGFVDELEQEDDPSALDTPWPDLNEHIQFKPKEVTVVGAATSGGKSLLAINQAAHVAFRRRQPVVVFSIEMGGNELLGRITSSEANIELSKLVRRKLDDLEWRKIARISDRMTSEEAANFVIDDSPSITIPKIRSRIRWMVSQDRKPALVVVDYAQIVKPHGPNAGKNRTQDVANISIGMKEIADEFEVPVLLLAQFNRGAVGRQPLVSDFKDSSQIEQDASTVLLLHRELDEEGNDTGANAGKVMVIIAKNRNGQRGVETWLQFEGRYASLRNLTTQTPPR